MAARQSDKATPKKTRTTRGRRQGESLSAQEIAKTKTAFLVDYALHGSVGAACDKAHIHRSTIYRWQEHDEAFGFAFEQARADYCDKLRREIDRRATQGVLEPVASAGKVVAHVRKYSDTLLIFQAKAHMPEYREKLDVKAEIQGRLGHDINIAADAAASASANAFFRRLSELRASDTTGSSASGEQ